MTIIAQAPVRLAAAELAPASLWRRWRYAGGRRDARLDFLRGFSAFAMVVDHLGGERSLLYPITGGNRFYTGAAEAFVFISGLVMGIVYRDVIDRHGIGAALVQSLKRAWTLYALTVFLTLSFPAISSLLDLPWAPDLTAAEAPAFVVGVLTLHQTFFLADILLMYTFLVLGTGPVLALLAGGRTAWVLAFSWGLWLLWQIWPEQAQIPWAVAGNDVFMIPAWQALFVTALVIGYHRRAIEQRLAWLSPRTVLPASGALIAVAVALYYDGLAPLSDHGVLAGQFFDKADVPAGRLIAFAASFSLAFALVTVLWTPVRWAFGWLLLPLGHHALSAYALHIFVIALLWKTAPLVLGDGTRSAVENALLQLSGVLIVWGAVIGWPRVAPVVDCCQQCRRATAGAFWRVRSHGRGVAEGGGASPAPGADTALAGDARSGGGSGPAGCGHPEPHAHCA